MFKSIFDYHFSLLIAHNKFVSNEAVFESANKLGSWSTQLAKFNLQEIVSNASFLRLEDISSINMVALSEKGSEAFNYYLFRN